jgi:hypothetical protein
MIEDIKALQTGLQPQPLVNRELTRHSRIDCNKAWPYNSVSSGITEGAGRLYCKCRGIEPLRDGFRTSVRSLACNQVWPVFTIVGTADVAGGVEDGKRAPRLPGYDS